MDQADGQDGEVPVAEIDGEVRGNGQDGEVGAGHGCLVGFYDVCWLMEEEEMGHEETNSSRTNQIVDVPESDVFSQDLDS